MKVIHSIEIGAKCCSDNSAARNLIKSLSSTIKLTLSGSMQKSHSITFDDRDELHNKNRYAIVLSKHELSYPISDIHTVTLDWPNTIDDGVRGHLELRLSSDEAHYDHILTDVRYNDRTLPIRPGCYSVCSSIFDGISYIDIYLTIHTAMLFICDTLLSDG